MKKNNSDISFNLVSKNKLDSLDSDDKLKFIIKEVKKGKILVLEYGLTPVEQAGLIEKTMREIKDDTFIGVEMESYNAESQSFIRRILGISSKPRMTLIGPADLLKMVKKDNEMIQTKIIPGKGAK